MFETTSAESVLHCSNEFEIQQAVLDCHQTFKSGYTRSPEFRRHQLEQLWRLLDDNETLLCDALYRDLRKNKNESLFGEIIRIKEAINYMLIHLDEWIKDERVKSSSSDFISNVCIKRKEPKGCVLIICDWSHPVYLVFAPLMGAIAAGCTAVVKISELAPQTANLFAELIPRYLDAVAFTFINGTISETTDLLKHKWDHIFYCGNGGIAKVVMKSASKYLTSLTLEIGGKNPVIIDDDINFALAARRVAFGKLVNSGQSFDAPDYVLITAKSESRFMEELEKAFYELYGDNPRLSKDYSRIINNYHFKRLAELIEENQSGTILIGGQTDEKDLYIAPTVISNVSRDDKMMENGIFGPLLPIIIVADIDDAIEFINSKGEPLALYVFANNKKHINKILDSTRSGSVLINDTLVQTTELSLPFGGLGKSGTGSYNGKASFEAFTHVRSVMSKSLNPLVEIHQSLRYAPYRGWKTIIVRMLLESIPTFKRGFVSKYFKWILYMVLAAYGYKRISG